MTISPDNVASLTISSKCFETDPCQHSCAVLLKNKMGIEKKLNKREISSLLNVIHPSRVIYHQDGFVTAYPPHKFKTSTETATQVLTNIFRDSGLTPEQQKVM